MGGTGQARLYQFNRETGALFGSLWIRQNEREERNVGELLPVHGHRREQVRSCTCSCSSPASDTARLPLPSSPHPPPVAANAQHLAPRWPQGQRRRGGRLEARLPGGWVRPGTTKAAVPGRPASCAGTAQSRRRLWLGGRQAVSFLPRAPARLQRRSARPRPRHVAGVAGVGGDPIRAGTAGNAAAAAPARRLRWEEEGRAGVACEQVREDSQCPGPRFKG
jgi:hypothetical protein